MNTREYRMTFEDEAKMIVKQMTLEEKIYMLSGHCKPTESMGGGSYNAVPYPFGGCERLGVPELNFCDGPRGVVSGRSTCFPVAVACGATFDRELEYQVGTAIGKEVLGNGGNFFGGVCMNIPYHPGAGRSQESFGEDSYHMGEMATALMRGVQDQGVIACAKHFALNSMEKSRFKVDMDADKRTEREVYFPHFKKVIDNGAASVMNAYNLYKGDKCGHSKYLLREVLKGEWGFDGFVMSDFMLGVTDTSKGLTGGCDVEMHFTNKYSQKKVKKALEQGTVKMKQIDEACLRIVRTTLAFEKQRESLPKVDSKVIACRDHIALARKVAEESITLLQNKDNLLPLKKSMKIALVGDLADVENIGDHGSSKVRPPYVKTLVRAMKKEYPDVTFSFVKTAEVKRRIDAIKMADAVVMVCGMRHGDEGEFVFLFGGDRESLELHKKELNMINAVSNVNKNCAVVLMGGNAIMTHNWKDKVKSILFAYYPGMEGGAALADILFGKVNPSGRLPFAIGADENDYPAMKWNTKDKKYEYYHGYHLFDKKGYVYDFPYGYGLSYTEFEIGEARLTENNDQYAIFDVEVKNTGKMAGAEVVQLYVAFPDSAVDRPVRTLMGFEKVFLNSGESKIVSLKVQKEELRWYDESKKDFVADESYEAFVGQNEQYISNKGIRF